MTSTDRARRLLSHGRPSVVCVQLPWCPTYLGIASNSPIYTECEVVRRDWLKHCRQACLQMMLNLQHPDTMVMIERSLYPWSLDVNTLALTCVGVRQCCPSRNHLRKLLYLHRHSSSFVAGWLPVTFWRNKMSYTILLLLALAAPSFALVRFHCSQLVVERLDPLVTPGLAPSPHVHQIVGTYSRLFNLPLPLL